MYQILAFCDFTLFSLFWNTYNNILTPSTPICWCGMVFGYNGPFMREALKRSYVQCKNDK